MPTTKNGTVETLEKKIGPYYWAGVHGFILYAEFADLLVRHAAIEARKGNEAEAQRLLNRAKEVLAGEEDALAPKR